MLPACVRLRDLHSREEFGPQHSIVWVFPHISVYCRNASPMFSIPLVITCIYPSRGHCFSLNLWLCTNFLQEKIEYQYNNNNNKRVVYVLWLLFIYEFISWKKGVKAWTMWLSRSQLDLSGELTVCLLESVILQYVAHYWHNIYSSGARIMWCYFLRTDKTLPWSRQTKE